jgi:hypothetical protein
MVQPTASFSSSSEAPDRLIAGDFPLLSRPITLVSGQDLARGAVLGKITTGGKYTLSLSAAGDGSEVPDAVLALDCDASGGDKATVAHFRGEFNEDELTIGTGHTVDSIREGLRGKGIWLVKAQPVDDL